MLCFQCCLPLWSDVRTVQPELCKKCSGKKERSAYSSGATALAAADTQEEKRPKEGTVDQKNEKVLLKYSFLNQDVSLWNWARSLSHLKLKYFILKQAMSQLKC